MMHHMPVNGHDADDGENGHAVELVSQHLPKSDDLTMDIADFEVPAPSVRPPATTTKALISCLTLTNFVLGAALYYVVPTREAITRARATWQNDDDDASSGLNEYDMCSGNGVFEDGGCTCFDCFLGKMCTEEVAASECIVVAAGGRCKGGRGAGGVSLAAQGNLPIVVQSCPDSLAPPHVFAGTPLIFEGDRVRERSRHSTQLPATLYPPRKN